jgi:hypothetical protein
LGEGSAAQVTKNMLANEGLGSFYKVCSFGMLMISFTNSNTFSVHPVPSRIAICFY